MKYAKTDKAFECCIEEHKQSISCCFWSFKGRDRWENILSWHGTASNWWPRSIAMCTITCYQWLSNDTGSQLVMARRFGCLCCRLGKFPHDSVHQRPDAPTWTCLVLAVALWWQCACKQANHSMDEIQRGDRVPVSADHMFAVAYSCAELCTQH